MAALCPGVKYGLSSQEKFGENKDLIFVKLTDSSLRAIEDFLRNQNKLGFSSPTIKFLGNEGQLSFPSVRNGCTSFKFSLSTTADMERPGGSFECLQQKGHPRSPLGALGPILYKMHVHANEDVYEATRHRMTVAEENHKNKCTREIKPNQNDIGKKVKVKQSRPVIPSRRDSPSMRDSLTKPSYQSSVPSKLPVHLSNGLSNGLSNSYVSSSRPQNKPSVPDIARRPIKERLIHLLALRPFKKPELFERLNREGLREKSSVTSVLKQISSLKDNSYHLNRAMWNDVHEDWPFYTESEKQILKRRKPQNLTPPGSSDGGSSGSGQSPTSTHPGSPPPPISSSKRPGYYDGADGLPTKRQRISHYRKPSEQNYRSQIENNSQRRPVTDSRDASNMNPRSRESPTTNGYGGGAHGGAQPQAPPVTNGYSGNSNGMLNDKSKLSDDEDTAGRSRTCDSHSLSFGVDREKTFAEERSAEVSSSTQSRFSIASPDSQSAGDLADNPPADAKNEFPDYLTEYTTIKNQEQRRRYKEHFTADYAEYRKLHGIVEEVSRRFAELEEKLQETKGTPEHKNIKKKIFVEYLAKKQDKEHQRAKQRFQYLHDKLSHIKRLVLEYDEKNAVHRKY